MADLMDDGVPQQPHVDVRYGHTPVRLKDQSDKILVDYMFQYAEPNQRYQNLSMTIGLGGGAVGQFHNEDPRPCPVLIGRGLACTRSKAVLSLVTVPGVFEQFMLDAELVKVRTICLSITRNQP